MEDEETAGERARERACRITKKVQALILILARPLVLIHVPVYGAIKPFVSPADDVRILTRLGSRKSYECGMGEFFFTYELNING